MEAKEAAAADRAKKAEAAARALQEQQRETSHKLASVHKQMSKMSSKSATEKKMEEELTNLEKQVWNVLVCVYSLTACDASGCC